MSSKLDLDPGVIEDCCAAAVQIASGVAEAIESKTTVSVERTVARFNDTRPFAAMMIIVSGVLAALVTNDVALFVVIPFTVLAGRISDFDVEDEIIFQLIATNLLGCLTPLGNPQNIFIYHRTLWSVTQFVGTIPPGRAPLHSHVYDEVIYVVDGEGTLHTEGLDEPVAAGSCIHLPPFLLHSLDEQIERFVSLGLGRYEAIKAVEAGLDLHAAESLATGQGSDQPRR